MSRNYKFVSVRVSERLLVLLLLACLFMASLAIPTVHAESREGEPCLGVWVLFDEEYKPYNNQTYLQHITSALNPLKDWYSINYNILFYDTWDSDDSLYYADEILEEAKDQVGWNTKGMFVYGNWTHSDGSHDMQYNWANMLLAFSGQPMNQIGLAACAPPWYWNATIIASEVWRWYPEWKAIIHELGHHYGLQHCGHWQLIPPLVCFMNPDWWTMANAFMEDHDTQMHQNSDWFTWHAPAWDINEDGRCDIIDLSIVSMAFGRFYGEPGYNPDADINEDGIIDIRDIATVAYYYGEVYLSDL